MACRAHFRALCVLVMLMLQGVDALLSTAVHKKSVSVGGRAQQGGDLESFAQAVDQMSATSREASSSSREEVEADADDDARDEGEEEEEESPEVPDQQQQLVAPLDAEADEETSPSSNNVGKPRLALLEEIGSKVQEPEAPAESPGDAIKRVVLFLRTLQTEVKAEAKEEQKMLDQHLCWCQNERHSLKYAIGTGEEKIPQLQSDLMEADSSIAALQESKQKKSAEVEDGEKAITTATTLRNSERTAAGELTDELRANIGAIGKAITALESENPQSFLQTPAASVLRRMTRNPEFQNRLEDTDEGSRGGEALTSFLEGSRGSEGLDEIIGICKQLEENFNQDLDDANEREGKAETDFQKLLTAKTQAVSAGKQLVSQATSQLSSLTTKRGRLQDDLDATKESLAADQMFKKQLEESCHQVMEEHHKRQVFRHEELEAAQDAVDILSQDLVSGRMDQASGFQASFLQLGAEASAEGGSKRSHSHRQHNHRRHGRTHRAKVQSQLVLGLRGSAGGRKEPAVNFRLIHNMIDKTLLVLDTAQRKDDKEYAYCDREIKGAEGEQGDLTQQLQDLEAAKSEKNTTLEGLIDDIANLERSIKQQDELAANLTAARQAEHKEFVKSLVANNKAMELLEIARQRLQQMYERRGGGSALIQGGKPTLDAPRPDLKSAKAVLGDEVPANSGRSNRVLDLIDQVKGGIKAETQAAQDNENAAQREYEQMVQSAKDIRSQDTDRLIARESSRTDTEVRLHAIVRDLAAATVRQTQVAALLGDLHKKCDQLMANYEPHKQARKLEVQSLNNAKTTLNVASN